MILLAAALSIGVFLAVFARLGTLPAALGAVGEVRASLGVMNSATLDEAEKERAVRAAGLKLLRLVFDILWQSAAALLAAGAVIYLMDLLGLVAASAVFGFLARWDVIAVSFVGIGGAMYLWRRHSGAAGTGYSALDRGVHRLAFAHPAVAQGAADMEDRLFAADIADIPEHPPVFVTALARAGTTVLLEALNDLPQVATHTYRDMPFVMAPLLWSRLRGSFGQDGALRERAHGDGLQIGFDSPEAFEEVIWRHFWPDHYRGPRIRPWTAADADPDAAAFLRRHFRKIVALRVAPENREGGRYLSKNNGHIARLGLLPEMFPGARLVICLREPAAHAASLWRQHRNFVAQQAQDPFVTRYMRDIGHFEFGTQHKPFDFPGLDALIAGRSPDDPDYWLGYWIAAHRAVAAFDGDALMISHEALAADPGPGMAALCAALDLETAGTDPAARFRPAPPAAEDTVFDPALHAEARDIHAALLATALVGRRG